MAAPGTGSPESRRRVGSISRSPPGPISNQAHSPSAPNRFFPPASTRRPDRGSPSSVSTTSTACSSVRGPATSPSLVTCSVISTEIPSALARPTKASAHRRTCDGPPASWGPAASRSAWMESTASRKGWVFSARSITAARSRPGANVVVSPLTPIRLARAATWACDSSPETSRHGFPAAARFAKTRSRRVDLPIPGSPASSATDPARPHRRAPGRSPRIR